MFDNIKNIAEQAAAGNVDSQAVGDAASEHVNSMDPNELTDHVQTAATNLQQRGQGDLAQQAMDLVAQVRSNPAGAKDAIVAFIKNNPQVLEHFAPNFAQGILSRLNR